MSLLSGSRKPACFQLVEGGLELAGDLRSALVVAAEADMIVGEFLEVEYPVWLDVKPFAQGSGTCVAP